VTELDPGGVVRITFDDPATRNALRRTVLTDLVRKLAELTDNPAVRAVVLTGAGTAFSSGADRAELGDPTAVAQATELVDEVVELLTTLPVPVLARVNGPAFGSGLALVAAADIAIASTDAVFGFPEVRLGLVAGPAMAACRLRLNRTALLDLFLTGRRFDAVEATRMGLIARVVPPAELDAAVATTLADLAQGDPGALAATKRTIRAEL
jgi:methylglutaconyl-CoA hydratase